MEATRYSETSALSRSTLRHIPDDSTLLRIIMFGRFKDLKRKFLLQSIILQPRETQERPQESLHPG
jgi:hypothetical protein